MKAQDKKTKKEGKKKNKDIMKSLNFSFFFFFLNLTSIPGPERSIWRQLPSWFEHNTPIV
jgi:hypothetical protein